MAKVRNTPDRLRMELFSPGMSILHRAGLGGLACTLQAIEREYHRERLAASNVPGSFLNDRPPWDIEEREITLHFGKPDEAADFLKKLFAFAFGIRNDGLISLPGQHESEPATPVLADLQTGLTLTFLQHGKVRKLAKEPTLVNYDPEADGVSGVVVQYRKCSGFKHQEGWEAFVDNKGRLASGPIRVDGPISPGTVVRHVAFTGDTVAEEPPERMLPLYFALVGCLALPVNRGVAALVVPDVENLLDFVYDRPAMTPSTARDCQIAGGADAAFRAQLRMRKNPTRDAHVKLRAKRTLGGSTIPGCQVMTFMPTAWASQQKSRVATVHVPPGEERILDRFDRALGHLPPRIAVRTIRESSGTGRSKTVVERREEFRSDSIVRPLIADNLARSRPWYAGFANLMTRVNPATDRPYRQQLNFERKGLHDMISDTGMWDDEGEALVVKAVHEAMRRRYGQIAKENEGKPAAMKNRMQGFREKLRIDLAGAKTEAHVRFALMDLFSRGGNNAVLREGWQQILPVIRRDWHLARDLALLALASYAGRGETNDADETKPS